MLMASVLAVVAGSPSQAANTSGEVLIDTNGDGVDDSREFAGSHRYNTAVALAQQFAEDEGSISTVIVASGETQVDAVTASGLAGNLNAPVLLTRSSQLPHNVARFIDEQNVTDVVVVGGTASVPDSIVTAIESLGSRPSVKRVAGADRYATAAAIGDELGGPNPTWCGTSQPAAILVNGGDDGRADAVISGPLAFRLGLPILLTMADEVPESTSAFLTDNKVERVVVVGGAGAVSADVVNTLVEDVGVVNVQRISGGSAAATSVMVAKEMLGTCAAVLGTNPDMVALVNRAATADGITAAPVLGRGIEDYGGGSIPILLVGDELPAAVSDYLASTAEVRGGQKTHQRILAIGGTAVVSNSVMADAVAAAKTSSMLTATIAAKKDANGQYTNTFSVTFSDDVKLPEDADDPADGIQPDEQRGTVLDPTMYRVNGRRIEALVDTSTNPVNEESIGALDLIFTADRTVEITLSHKLEAGDEISVVGGRKVGDNGDERKLEAASLTLAAVAQASDRNAPVVEIIGVPGSAVIVIYVTEPNPLHNELTDTEWDSYIKVDGKGSREVTISQPTVVTSPANERQGTHMRMTATVTTVTIGEATQPTALIAGDVITIERQAILDKSGRGNSLRRLTVPAIKADGKFEITSVSIGDNRHDAQAVATITSIGTDTDPKMVIKAKKGGAADGAAGNDWVMYGYDDRAAADASTLAFDIDVAVDMANQVISYTISDVVPNKDIARNANLADLAGALVSNSDFAANFSVDYVRDAEGRTAASKATALGATNPGGLHFMNGVTSVAVLVQFNDAVASLGSTTAGSYSAGDGSALAADIAGMIDTDGATDGAQLALAAGDLGGTDLTADSDNVVVSFVPPDNQVHISYASHDVTRLPTRAGFRVIAAGVAQGYGDSVNTPNVTAVTNIREILNSLRPNSGIKPVAFTTPS